MSPEQHKGREYLIEPEGKIKFDGVKAKFEAKDVAAKQNTAVEQFNLSAMGGIIGEVDAALDEALTKMTEKEEQAEPHRWEAIQKARDLVNAAKERATASRDAAALLQRAKTLLETCGAELTGVVSILNEADKISMNSADAAADEENPAAAIQNLAETTIANKVGALDTRMKSARQKAADEKVNYQGQISKYRKAWREEAQKSPEWKKARTSITQIEATQTRVTENSQIMIELQACGLVTCEKIVAAARTREVDEILKQIDILQQIRTRRDATARKLANDLDTNSWSQDPEKTRKHSLAVSGEITQKSKEDEQANQAMMHEIENGYTEGYPDAAVEASSKYFSDLIGKKKIDAPYLTSKSLSTHRAENTYVTAGAKSVEEMLGCTVKEEGGEIVLALPEGEEVTTTEPLYGQILRGKSVQMELLSRIEQTSSDDIDGLIRIGTEFEKNESNLRALVKNAEGRVRTIKLEQAKTKWKERMVKGGKALAVGVVAGAAVYVLGEAAGQVGEHFAQSGLAESQQILADAAQKVAEIKSTVQSLPELQDTVTKLYSSLGDAGKSIMEAAQAKTLAAANQALDKGAQLALNITEKVSQLNAAQYVADNAPALIEQAQNIAQQQSVTAIASGEHKRELLQMTQDFLLNYGSIGAALAASLYYYRKQFKKITGKNKSSES